MIHMNPNKPKGEAQTHTADTVAAESEQITGEFAIDLGVLDEVVDDGTGRTPDPLVSVKRRIREAVDSADQS